MKIWSVEFLFVGYFVSDTTIEHLQFLMKERATHVRWSIRQTSVWGVCVCFLRGYTRGMLGDVGFSSVILPYSQHGMLNKI